MLVHNTLPGAR
uniref:Uncharacterized protein n=1 Tax=Anguilla anguilla TaxID=7936 RepID=A0A0E9RKA9_ANGAN